MSTILGIDPGTTTVGYAIIRKERGKPTIVDFGVIHTTPKIPLADKLLEIERDLSELIQTHRPDACGIETIIFAKNQKTAIDVAQSRGVIIHTVAKLAIPVFEYTPLQVKKGISGNGRAVKAQVQNAVKMLYGLEEIPKPDDAADALAIAYVTSLSYRPIIRQ